MRPAIIAVLVALHLVCSAISAEPWADPRLKMVDGLQLWLDASSQNEGRAQRKLPPLKHLQPTDLWLDASGQGRHLLQKAANRQPLFHSIDNHIAFRFDGRQQCLQLSGLGSSLREVTCFVVAVPFRNPGYFRGFLAINKIGVNDYVSGLNLDLGPLPTTRWETLNAEGAGFGGAVNLMRQAHDFGTVQQICLTTTPGKAGVQLLVNGKLQGQRDRADTILAMDQITVGARFYSHGAPPAVRDCLDGDLCEVLLYNRRMSDAERIEVEKYLASKHTMGKAVPIPQRSEAGKSLVTIRNPPPVQVFVPGFTVKQLPVDLPNVNNVLYRPDGKLVALGYNGNIYLLSDRDGDGLEDKVELFWENKGGLLAPIGMALTPPGYRHGQGVFVASKGKCSLIVDTDGDGKADREIVVAEGWKPLPHGVDALGVAVDPRDGSVYFGLGCADFTNAYQVDKQGNAGYRLDSERGTILRVEPDFKKRTIVATGIRFPVGIRLNADGELFCTDQEGATWLANGNPFDELLHIQPGRHYGFPPRHPRHLPKVIDEPSLFDYAPQHQSTCGLNFNEPLQTGGPIFGPRFWQGDALVTGYSRGKLYRTSLVKTPAGYFARNQLLASLTSLTVDAAVAPNGSLIVATHSGGPDWGSGPGGKGKLFKLFYTGQSLPQPVLAWVEGPQEVRVAFDRALEPEHLRKLTGQVRIEQGLYVSPGDRFEVLRPGYQVVQDQLLAPRHDLPVLSVQTTGDRRTLLLTTGAHLQAAPAALTLPGLGRPENHDPEKNELPQMPETDLAYDLCGVEAVWQSDDGKSRWTGWLPHLELTVSRAVTASSALHDQLWALTRQPGRLTMKTRLNLWHMLRPAVQPGSKVDHDWPAEQVTLKLRTRSDLIVQFANRHAAVENRNDGWETSTLTLDPRSGSPLPVEVSIATGPNQPELSLTWHTQDDGRPRALPLNRLLLPWVPTERVSTGDSLKRGKPELQGGDWARGRDLFFGDKALCSRCHQVHGQGGKIGPNLSNLTERDYASVLRDITNPSFALNPDYLTQVVELTTGQTIVGVVRTEGKQLIIGDNNGKEHLVERSQVETIATSSLSIMPEGIDKQLRPEELRDLLTFLLTDPPRMPDYGKGTPPPPRSLKEVQAVLAGAEKPPAKPRPLHVILVAGKKDHGPGEHDYPAWQKVWQQLLSQAEGVKVSTAMDWPAPEQWKSGDVLVFYQRGQWTPERAKDIDAFLERGGGLVYLHYAVDGGTDAPGFAQRIGLAWQGGKSKFRHGMVELGFETGSKHPIGRNLDRVRFEDESYWQLAGDPKRIQLLASGLEDGKPQPLFWTIEQGRGRVFVSILGHFAWTFDDPLFRVVLLRSIAWTAKEPVDRFNQLVLPGARVKE